MTRNSYPIVCLTLLAIFALASSVGLADGPAQLLKDINQAGFHRGSFPDRFGRLGDMMLFRATTPAFGAELWKTDGTATGTSLVKDVLPGPMGGLERADPPGFVPDFVEVNGVLLFPATDLVHGYEVWRTDGTAEGTFMLADIRPGDISGLETYPPNNRLVRVWVHAVSAGLAYFLADDGVHGFELYRTDGTPEGTFLLADIFPGRQSAFGATGQYVLDGATLGSFFYFRAGPSGVLYRTDGTSAGTAIAQDIVVAPGLRPQHLTRVGALIYFQLDEDLYRTDGTAAGTIRLHTFNSPTMEFHGEVNGRLLFRSDDGLHGLEPWISDGTPAGTHLLKDISPNPVSYGFRHLARLGSVAWFQADDGVHGPEVWRSDGTRDGTRLVADVTPGPAGTTISEAVPFPGGVLLRTPGGLVRIGPSEWEITRIAAPASSGSGLAVLGNRVLFSADDGEHGDELWGSDGTQAGTSMLADVDPQTRTAESSPAGVGVAIDASGIERLIFRAYDGEDWTLWSTDGTPRGTTRLATLLPMTSAPLVGTLHGILYFAAREYGDWELWRTDGTSPGTRKVNDRFGGAGILYSSPVASRDRIYFAVREPQHGFELWSSDGSEAGARFVADIYPGLAWSRIHEMVMAGDTLFFTAFLDRGTELWTSDGTAAGTRVVKSEYGWRASCCTILGPLGGRLLFLASSGLWISDGSEAGTLRLKEPGSFHSISQPAPVAGRHAYFLESGALWKTDGTEAGTRMVKDLRAGRGYFTIELLGPIGDSVVFMIQSESDWTKELWKSDGTEAGTVQVREAFLRHPWGLETFAAFEGGILFSELGDLHHGLELWRTDGTTEGTALVQDLAPGPAWASPHGFVAFGSRILFTADDPVADDEPFVGRAAILLGQPQRALSDLREDLRTLGLPKGIETSLAAKLNAAEGALGAGRRTESVLHLENFIRHVQARIPGRIDAAAAADLIEFSQDLLNLLEARSSPAQD